MMTTANSLDQNLFLATKSPPASPLHWQFAITAVLATVGFALASYLAWHSFYASPVAGCGGSQVFDCEHVLNSRWSKVMGVPVGVLALPTYAMAILGSLACLTSSRQETSDRAQKLVVFTSLAAGFAALWFITLQVFVLRHLCFYCLTAHLCSLAMATTVLIARIPLPKSQYIKLGSLGLASVVTVATIQALETPAPTYTIETHIVESNTATASGSFQDTEEVFSPFSAEFAVEEVFDPFAMDDDETTTNVATEAKPNATPQQTNGSDSDGGAIQNPRSVTMRQNEKAYPRPRSRIAVNTYAHRSLSPALFLLKPSLLLSGVVTTDDTPVTPSRKVSILGGVTLSSAQWPVVGRPDAKYMIVEMFDYTCPHCRKTHPALEQTARHYGDDFALLVVPVPMHSNCNDTVTKNHTSHHNACELAKLAIAVWLTDAQAFPTFHDWMMQGSTAPSNDAALTKAMELVDSSELKSQLASRIPTRYLVNTIKLYKRAGKGIIPKLLFPKTSLVGKTESPEILRQLIEQNF